MPQPTRPASVRIVQYCPLRQRLLMPIAEPFLNWIGREIVRGSGSLMGSLRDVSPRQARRSRPSTSAERGFGRGPRWALRLGLWFFLARVISPLEIILQLRDGLRQRVG